MIVAGFLGGVAADFCLEGIFLLALIAALIFVLLSVFVMPTVQRNVKKRKKYSIGDNINEMKKSLVKVFDIALRTRVSEILFYSIVF